MTTELKEEHRVKLDNIVGQMVANGESDENIQWVVDDFKQKYSTMQPTVDAPKEEGFLSKTGSDIKKRFSNIKDIATRDVEGANKFKYPSIEAGKGINVAGQVASLYTDILGNAATGIYKTLVPKKAKELLGEGTKLAYPTLYSSYEGLKSLIGQPEVQNTVKTVADSYKWLKDKDPETMRLLESLLNIGTVVPINKLGAKVASPIIEGAEKGFGAAKGAYLKTSAEMIGKEGLEESIDSIVKKQYPRIIKPVFKGATYKEIMKNASNVGTVVKDMVFNRKNLRYTDEAGNAVIGKMPTNVREWNEIIQNRMKDIFDNYNSLMINAGERGFDINAKPIAEELYKFVNDPFNQTFSKEAVKYAETMMNDLKKMKRFDVEFGQKLIKLANSKLEKAPNFDEWSKAMVDLTVANMTRDAMENAISGGYSDLKKLYGQYKSIQKDIGRAQFRMAKGQESGINFFDIVSAAGLTHAMTTGTSLTPYVLMEGMNVWRRYYRNPEVRFRKMFDKISDRADIAERLVDKSPLSAERLIEYSRRMPGQDDSFVKGVQAAPPSVRLLPYDETKQGFASGRSPIYPPMQDSSSVNITSGKGAYPPQTAFPKGKNPSIVGSKATEVFGKLPSELTADELTKKSFDVYWNMVNVWDISPEVALEELKRRGLK